MDKNISLQEPFVKFKDLLARMVAEEILRSRLHEVSSFKDVEHLTVDQAAMTTKEAKKAQRSTGA